MLKKAFDEENIRHIILTWYSSTNDHRPIQELVTMLSEKVEMRYPNSPEPVMGHEGFRKWYEDVLGKYFDETHKVESWKISMENLTAVAEVTVRWECRSWKVGRARSSYKAYLSKQYFEIERIPDTGAALITKKIVKTFDRTTPLYGIGI